MRQLSILATIILALVITSFAPTDSPAIYEEGEDAMYKTIAKTIRYPKAARDENRTGLVLVSFTVNEKGDVVDVSTRLKEGQLLKECVVVGYSASDGEARHPNEAMEEEVIRSVRELGKFTPAQKDGQAVSTTLVLPMKFMLK